MMMICELVTCTGVCCTKWTLLGRGPGLLLISLLPFLFLSLLPFLTPRHQQLHYHSFFLVINCCLCLWSISPNFPHSRSAKDMKELDMCTWTLYYYLEASGLGMCTSWRLYYLETKDMTVLSMCTWRLGQLQHMKRNIFICYSPHTRSILYCKLKKTWSVRNISIRIHGAPTLVCYYCQVRLSPI